MSATVKVMPCSAATCSAVSPAAAQRAIAALTMASSSAWVRCVSTVPEAGCTGGSAGGGSTGVGSTGVGSDVGASGPDGAMMRHSPLTSARSTVAATVLFWISSAIAQQDVAGAVAVDVADAEDMPTGLQLPEDVPVGKIARAV